MGKLPDGVDVLEELKRVDPGFYQRLVDNALHQLLAVYGHAEGWVEELSEEDWLAFKAARAAGKTKG